MKVTKKQWLIGGAVLVVLAGGATTIGVVKHNADVAYAAEQKEKAQAKAYEKKLSLSTKAVQKAEKSKVLGDVDAAKKLVSALKSIDKSALQKRLDAVNKSIADAKAKAEADKKAAEEKAKAEQEAAQASQDQVSDSSTDSGGYVVAPESPSAGYVAPQAPSQGNGYVAPQAPSQGGGYVAPPAQDNSGVMGDFNTDINTPLPPASVGDWSNVPGAKG